MVSWLGAGGLVLVFWWMELDLVSLKGSAMSSSEFWDVYVFGMLGMALAAFLLMAGLAGREGELAGIGGISFVCKVIYNLQCSK